VSRNVYRYADNTMTLATYKEADKLAGFRLDRRKHYLIEGSEVQEKGYFTTRCSGCCCGCEMGGCGCGNVGCRECGYTGRTRHVEWGPVIKPAV
jgi:hypothetical protein